MAKKVKAASSKSLLVFKLSTKVTAGRGTFAKYKAGKISEWGELPAGTLVRGVEYHPDSVVTLEASDWLGSRWTKFVLVSQWLTV